MTTAKELFDAMPDNFKPEKAAGLNATVQFNLSGDNGGTWAVKVADGKCTVTEGPAESPTLTISMDAADYVAMVKGDLPAMNAFMQGKIKLQGDMGLAMKFQNLFG